MRRIRGLWLVQKDCVWTISLSKTCCNAKSGVTSAELNEVNFFSERKYQSLKFKKIKCNLKKWILVHIQRYNCPFILAYMYVIYTQTPLKLYIGIVLVVFLS